MHPGSDWAAWLKAPSPIPSHSVHPSQRRPKVFNSAGAHTSPLLPSFLSPICLPLADICTV